MTGRIFSGSVISNSQFIPVFFFTRIEKVGQLYYHVSVLDKSNRRQFFNMEMKNGRWKIVNAPKVEDWIMELENEIESIIIANS